MNRPIGWGIMGCGAIAHKFVEALIKVSGAKLQAAGSRSMEKARNFANQYGAERAHGSYESLIQDPEVDIVYIATPHNYHRENATLCLNHNKHVLCEKPMTVNASETEELIALARANRLFLMEAVWMRFFPVMSNLRTWLNDDIIGDIHMLKADFGISRPFEPKNRLFSPSLAGGALLDVGIYPINFCQMIMKEKPGKIHSSAYIGTSGVDEQSACLLTYEHGAMGLLSCAIRTKTNHNAEIIGSKGIITIPSFWKGEEATITNEDEEPISHLFPFDENGYEYEIKEVHRCLNKKLLESPLMPLGETLSIMQIMDEIREQWGLKYPFEK